MARRKYISVRPKNYRRIALHAIAHAEQPVVLMNKEVVTDFSERGPLTQKRIRECRNFEIRDGAEMILGFHDHPDEMWIAEVHLTLAEHCHAEGWLTIEA